jgi:hypothetical protein
MKKQIKPLQTNEKKGPGTIDGAYAPGYRVNLGCSKLNTKVGKVGVLAEQAP